MALTFAFTPIPGFFVQYPIPIYCFLNRVSTILETLRALYK